MARAIDWFLGLGCAALAAGVIAQWAGDDRKRDTPAASPAPPQQIQATAPEPEPPAPPAAPAVPIKLGVAQVPALRQYFTGSGYRFEAGPVPANDTRTIGTFQDGKTTVELVGVTALEQAILRYTLRSGDLGAQDMAVLMYLMQQVKADEPDVRWAIDAARKGEPTTRTIGAVAYAVQRGPNGSNEFVMRPAHGFE